MKYKYRNVVDWKYLVYLDCGHSIEVKKNGINYSGLSQSQYFKYHRVQCKQCGMIHQIQDILSKEDKSCVSDK